MRKYDLKPLGQIALVCMGQSPNGDDTNRDGLGYPLLNGPTEFGTRWPSVVQWTSVAPRTCEPRDILFCVRGSTTGRMNEADQAYAIGRGLAAIRGNRPSDTKYVYYAIRSVLPDLLSGVTGSTFPNLSRAQIESQSIPMPAPSIRQAIADVLGALDDKIAANDRVANLTKDLLAAHFADLRVDSNGRATLADLVELNPKVAPPAVEEPVYLDMKNLPDHAMTVTSWSHRSARGGARFQNGDTLLARITPCLENGKTGYVDFLQDDEVGIGSTEFIVMRARSGVPKLLSYFLSISPRFRDFAVKHMTGTSGRQRLAAADLVDFPVRRPTPNELDAFSELSDSLLERVKCAVDESRKLAAARDELLPLLMSGKVRVRDAEKVVEEVV